VGLALVSGMAAFAITQPGAHAATAPVLGAAENFAVLAGTTVTNTGPSVITPDLGVSPGTAVTGFGPGAGVVQGTVHPGDSAAAQAQLALTAAYNDAASRTPVSTVPTELGGTTRRPGVYNSAAGDFQITGTLTLDAQGDPNAVFIFKTASTLVTAAGNSAVVLTGGAQACNVFWQVGSSATLGTNTTFQGNILALTSITVTTGARIFGRALARNGAVTLDTNVITAPACAPVAEVSTSKLATITTTTTTKTTKTATATATTTATATARATATPTATAIRTATPRVRSTTFHHSHSNTTSEVDIDSNGHIYSNHHDHHHHHHHG
jgi:hypothetical protein